MSLIPKLADSLKSKNRFSTEEKIFSQGCSISTASAPAWISHLPACPTDFWLDSPHSHMNQLLRLLSLFMCMMYMYTCTPSPTASLSLENPITLYTNTPCSFPMSLPFHLAATKWPSYAFFLSYLSPNHPPGQMSRKWDGGVEGPIKPLKEATDPSRFFPVSLLSRTYCCYCYC